MNEIEGRRQDIEALEQEEHTAKARIHELNSELDRMASLLSQAQELERMGFDSQKLQHLHDVIEEIGAKRGQKPAEAIARFFGDLDDYDTKTGFEREIQRLETIAETKRLEAEKWQAQADNLSEQYRELAEVIAAAQSLTKHGVKAEQIVSWNVIVGKVGGPAELQDELGQYKSMSELLTAKTKKIEGCDKRERELSAEIQALREQKGEIEGAIKSLSATGVKEINKLSDKVMATLESLSNNAGQEITKVGDKAITGLKSLLDEMRVETKKLADLRAEAGKLEKELMYARYLTTADQTVLKSFPKEVVLSFLDRASAYCKLNQLNPMVRVPDDFPRKYSSVYSSTQISLVDLIAWAEGGLVGATQ